MRLKLGAAPDFGHDAENSPRRCQFDGGSSCGDSFVAGPCPRGQTYWNRETFFDADGAGRVDSLVAQLLERGTRPLGPLYVTCARGSEIVAMELSEISDESDGL